MSSRGIWSKSPKYKAKPATLCTASTHTQHLLTNVCAGDSVRLYPHGFCEFRGLREVVELFSLVGRVTSERRVLGRAWSCPGMYDTETRAFLAQAMVVRGPGTFAVTHNFDDVIHLVSSWRTGMGTASTGCWASCRQTSCIASSSTCIIVTLLPEVRGSSIHI